MILVIRLSDVVCKWNLMFKIASRLVIKRRCKWFCGDRSETVIFRIQPEIPGMLRRMMGIDQIFFCQKNVLDKTNRRLEITAWNESFDSRVSVEEKCCYYAEGNKTKFSQAAKLKIHSFWGLESTVEKLMITHYKVLFLKFLMVSVFFFLFSLQWNREKKF